MSKWFAANSDSDTSSSSSDSEDERGAPQQSAFLVRLIFFYFHIMTNCRLDVHIFNVLHMCMYINQDLTANVNEFYSLEISDTYVFGFLVFWIVLWL